jgi:transcriptional regulator with XRE-family HTH domain
MNLRNNLQTLLKERGLTVAKLSRDSGVPKSTLSDWMTSQVSVNLDQLRKVADTLGVPVFRLAYDLNDGDPHETRFSDEVLSELFSGRLQVTIHRVETTSKKK